MAVIWATGPHHGRVPSATANTPRRYVDGASSVSAVSLGGGEYAISCSGSSTTSNISLTTNTIGTTTQLVMSGKLRFPTSLPSPNSPDLAVSGSSGGDDLYLFFQNSSSKLAVAWGAGSPVLSASVVTADVDYTIDFHVDRSANPNVLHWWINGVAQTDCSAAQSSGNVSGFTWGRDSAATGTYYWRDLRVSVTGADAPLGSGKVHTLSPSGTATEVGTANALARFTSNGSGLDSTFNSSDIMAAISEIPPVVSGSASGIYQRTSSTTSFARIPMSSVTIGSGTVELVTIRVLAWAGSSLAYTLALRVWDGSSSTTVIALEDPNGSNSTSDPTWWCATYAPVGGWDQTKLDGIEIEIGGSNDVSPPPGAHAIIIEVSIKASTGGTAYTQSVGGTISPVGTLVKSTSTRKTGTVTPTGSISKATGRSLSGAIAPAGTVRRATSRLLSGSITPTGLLLRGVSRALGGSVAPAGTVAKSTSRTLSGQTAPAGALAKSTSRSLSGAIAPTGSISRAISRQLGGAIAPAGAILKLISRLLGGSVTPVGSLTNDAPTPAAFVVDVGPPSTSWSTAGPDAAWESGPPETGWTASAPREG